jgi:diguanylate cyclase (GGDEF)-like protein/PAS domain S-box-containing protein
MVMLMLMAGPVWGAENVSLQLKWFHSFQFAGYYVAQEQGFYVREGLEVDIRQRDRNQDKSHIDQVLAGEATYGVADSSIILQRLRGKPTVALAAIFQHSPLVLITRAKDRLLGPHELRGKRVMRQKGIDDAVLTAMFHQERIRENEVVHVPHTFDEQALIRGEVDAISSYLTNQPYTYARNGLDIHIINPVNYGIDFYGDMLFTSEQEMRANPERTLRFLRASLDGWRHALKHPEETVDLILRHYPTQRDRDHLLFEAEAIQRMAIPELVELGHLNVNRFQRIADIYRQVGMAPMDSSFAGIDYKDYLNQPTSLPVWLYWAVGLVCVLTVLVLTLLAINARLEQQVRARTRDIEATRNDLQRYLDIVDRHVIASSTDREGKITYASAALCSISGYARDELVGEKHDLFCHPDVGDPLYREIWHRLLEGDPWEGEIKSLKKNGDTYWVHAHIEPSRDHHGTITGFTSIRQDITDRKRVEELSVTDQLTRLFNRMKLDQSFGTELERARRYDHPLSIILFDIDHFKSVNDTFGHQTGDQVLIEMANLIRSSVRTTDIPGRWGGEEFLILCPETDTRGARALAEKLRQAMEIYPFTTVGHKTSSFGVTTRLPGESADDMVARADSALYAAKSAGRNRVHAA